MLLSFSPDGRRMPEITEALFNRVVQLVIVQLYVTSPQGRPEGIETLRLAHVEEWRDKHFALNTQFKTAATFVYQPVMLPDAVVPLLQLYLNYLRPGVLPPHAVAHRDDFLWLGFDGKPVCNMSARVIRYFRDRRNWHITITQLRAMLETEAARRHANGELSDAQRTAVSVVSGHSRATANRHYTYRESFAETVREARSVMGAPASAPSTAAIVLGVPLPVVDVWGINHPDREITVGRARWTAEERNHLADLIKQVLSEQEHVYEGQLLKECLRRIKADRSTRLIYHARHVYSTDRLRAGHRVKLVQNHPDV